MEPTHEMTGDSCNAGERKPKDLLPFRARDHAQDYPPLCPQEKPRIEGEERGREEDVLGQPLSIQEAARLIGCSPWTVRHRSLDQGIPFLRTGPTGKLIFYRQQVIRWLLDQQQKGGVE
jgi:hypothetical protein